MAITAATVETARLRQQVHRTPDEAGQGVLFLHGNLSDGAVWAEQMAALPDGYQGLAPSLRGYGGTEPLPVSAATGLADWAADVAAACDALGVGSAHVVAHSMGAGVALRLALDRPELIRSLVLVAPMSPYGVGGTDADGHPTSASFAGSGGGTANPELVRRIAAGDRSDEDPLSPRNVVRSLYFPGPEAVRHEELLLEGILGSRVGDDHYPGTVETTDDWPGVAPGDRGVLNAISPKHCDLSGVADAGLQVPVLWVRGGADAIISDASMVDLGNLGAIGAVPGWPGADAFPAQPMEEQMRRVLQRYAEGGGSFTEVVFDDSGHFPYLQEPDRFAALLAEHLAA